MGSGEDNPRMMNGHLLLLQRKLRATILWHSHISLSAVGSVPSIIEVVNIKLGPM